MDVRLVDTVEEAPAPRRWAAARGPVALALLAGAALGSLATLAVGAARGPGVRGANIDGAGIVQGTELVASDFTEIIVVRHCDKYVLPNGLNDNSVPQDICTPRGYARSQYFPSLFGMSTGAAEKALRADNKTGRLENLPVPKLPVPTQLFARKLEPSESASRMIWLLWPTAHRFNIRVNTDFAVDQTPQLAEFLRNQLPAGEVAVVSWNHCQISWLLQLLGCDDDRCKACWSDRDYESIFRLRFDRSKGTSAPRPVEVEVLQENFYPLAPGTPPMYAECPGKNGWDACTPAPGVTIGPSN